MSNEPKHSPMPWRVTVAGHIAGQDGFVPIRTPFHDRAFKDGPARSTIHPETQLQANTALIVRAVNAHDALVAACKAAMEWAAAYPLGIASCEPDIRAATDVYRRCNTALKGEA